MATVVKKNKKYCVVYYYVDSNGQKKQKWEQFTSVKDARNRKLQVEEEIETNGFIVPKKETVGTFLDSFVELYGTTHWGPSTYAANVSLIERYIKPEIGDIRIQELKPINIEVYYRNLADCKDARKKYGTKDKKVGQSVIRDVHKVLKCAFNQAVKWEIISSNPFNKVDNPKVKYKKREIWDSSQIAKALEVCDDPKLSIAIQLSFACSLRIGEVLGLQWKNVNISDEAIKNDDAYLYVECVLERVDINAVEATSKEDIYFVFPPQLEKACTTQVVLKKPKTESSRRKIWLPKTLALLLRDWKANQDEYKYYFGDDYYDYGLVLTHEDGRPLDATVIRYGLKRLAKEAGLDPVVFHSFRHTSTTYKLKLNHGDIKATQGDTGHAQADMVTEIYGHILDEDRKINAQKFEESFYQKSGQGIDYQKKQAAKKTEEILDEIKNNPELMNRLIDALKAK